MTSETAEQPTKSPWATTAEAASYLNLRSDCLRRWACQDAGPFLPSGQRLRPVKVNTVLRWRWADLHALAPATAPEAA